MRDPVGPAWQRGFWAVGALSLVGTIPAALTPTASAGWLAAAAACLAVLYGYTVWLRIGAREGRPLGRCALFALIGGSFEAMASFGGVAVWRGTGEGTQAAVLIGALFVLAVAVALAVRRWVYRALSGTAGGRALGGALGLGVLFWIVLRIVSPAVALYLILGGMLFVAAAIPVLSAGLSNRTDAARRA